MALITHVRRHELGLWFRHGDFFRLLRPGRHFTPGTLLITGRDRIEIADTLAPRFEHRLLDVFVKVPELREALVLVDLGDLERALVWQDGRLGWILGPGRHAFWKEPYRLEVEVFDIAKQPRLEHPKLEVVLAQDQSNLLHDVGVDSNEEVLLVQDGGVVGRLESGKHAFWKGGSRFSFVRVDRREQQLDVAGQEIMTADKVTLRLNLVLTWRVLDAQKAVYEVADFRQAVYREAQLALRAAVGGRTLDQLLSDKEAVGAELRQVVAKRAAEFGVEVPTVGVRDLILPGEMKSLLNQVIEAEKQAQANVIRRREETAAVRSQLNTARLVSENPALQRAKELEALQEIFASAKATFVLGDGGLGERLGKLVAKAAGPD